MVDKSHTARIFTNITFVDLIARIIGGPMMYKLLDVKMAKSHLPAGLCFAVSFVSQTRFSSQEFCSDPRTDYLRNYFIAFPWLAKG